MPPGRPCSRARRAIVLGNHGRPRAWRATRREDSRVRAQGPFVGDNINPKFPNGDGVQLFLSFDLQPLPRGMIKSCEAAGQGTRASSGEPFAFPRQADGGRGDASNASRRRSGTAPAMANACSPSSQDGPFECDVTDVVDRRRSAGMAQLRLRFEKAGDGDGESKTWSISTPTQGAADQERAGPAGVGRRESTTCWRSN